MLTVAAWASRRPAPVLAMLLAGVLVGLAWGRALDRAGPDAALAGAVAPTGGLPLPALAPPADLGAPIPPETATERGRTAMAAALRAAVRRARAMGGDAEAAVVVEGWSSPVTAGRAGRQLRMWSTSKPVAAVAALEAARGRQPSAALASAMARAITHSENCPQRRVVLGLQTLAGGVPQARAAVQSVLRRAGGRTVSVTRDAPPPEPSCLPYLQRSAVPDPAAAALTLGVSLWTVADAARFAAALGAGTYGRPGEQVLALMRRPKRPSTEIASPNEYTADPAWGAGRALAGLRPAYKAGWGGTQQGRFVAAQLVAVRAGDRAVGISVAFHPARQPRLDDPGRTAAPRAIEEILRAVRRQLDAVAG